MKTMNDMIQAFLDYAVFNEEGDLEGIKDDAPKEAKEAYRAFRKVLDDAAKKGVVI